MHAYTKTPKWVWKALARGAFKPREAQVLAFVVDQVSGFNDRKGLRASTADIADATGIHPNHVRPTLKALIAKGALVENEYGFAPADEQPNQLPESNQNSCSEQPKQLPKTTKSVVSTRPKPAPVADSGKRQGNSQENYQVNTPPISPPLKVPAKKKRTVHEYPAWFEELNAKAPWPDKHPAYVEAMAWGPDEAMIAAFNAGLDRWLTSQRWAEGFICNGKTFFHQRRWEKDPPQVAQSRTVPQAPEAPKKARDYSW